MSGDGVASPEVSCDVASASGWQRETTSQRSNKLLRFAIRITSFHSSFTYRGWLDHELEQHQVEPQLFERRHTLSVTAGGRAQEVVRVGVRSAARSQTAWRMISARFENTRMRRAQKCRQAGKKTCRQTNRHRYTHHRHAHTSYTYGAKNKDTRRGL